MRWFLLLLSLCGAVRAEAQGIRAELTPAQAHLQGIEIGKDAKFKLNLKNRGVGTLEVKKVWTTNPDVKAT
ncbi:MAG: hypothetical protein AAF492_33665, partial [Verrucomicrobiota bacterium]